MKPSLQSLTTTEKSPMINKTDLEAFGYWTPDEDFDTFVRSEFDTYQLAVDELMLTSGDNRLMENTLGLVGETGEIAEKIKKHIRDGNPLDTADMAKELGDVLFYLAGLAYHLGISLSDIANGNLEKLYDRQKRGVLQGSGDNR